MVSGNRYRVALHLPANPLAVAPGDEYLNETLFSTMNQACHHITECREDYNENGIAKTSRMRSKMNRRILQMAGGDTGLGSVNKLISPRILNSRVICRIMVQANSKLRDLIGSAHLRSAHHSKVARRFRIKTPGRKIAGRSVFTIVACLTEATPARA